MIILERNTSIITKENLFYMTEKKIILVQTDV